MKREGRKMKWKGKEEEKDVKIWKEKENKYSSKQISRRSGEESESDKKKRLKRGVKEKKV